MYLFANNNVSMHLSAKPIVSEERGACIVNNFCVFPLWLHQRSHLGAFISSRLPDKDFVTRSSFLVPREDRSLSGDHNLSQMHDKPRFTGFMPCRSFVDTIQPLPSDVLATRDAPRSSSGIPPCLLLFRCEVFSCPLPSPSPSSPTPCSSPGRRSRTRPARCTPPTRTARRWRRASRRSRGGTTRRRRHPRRGARRRRPTFPRRRVRLLPARRSRAGTGALLSSRTVFHPSLERKHGPAGSLSIQYRSLLSAASSKLQGCCASASTSVSLVVVRRLASSVRQYPYA